MHNRTCLRIENLRKHKDIKLHKENYKIFVGSLPRKIKKGKKNIFWQTNT